ncbi:MAG: acylphosphatase [Lentimicrobium sp.]|jgi:acylphosphatase|nr:acylphosphatase [Lentimicrobium sp.]MDD2526682.1 acylphosphatase [Lentimicrobiaceae bacterium]MDD4598738.1 acylphosphatase [Lentimicrobiaceae bacterium]MDY0026873.1 acylphosphatase [Lentimicrobium sp.]HAH59411.1 acylphosphatase [Bacteroidales bacterium]
MEKQYIIQIFGRVQGVGFRYFVHRKATDLGLRGFVKNMPDRSVYVEAEGEAAALEILIHHCKQGPGHADVHEVKLVEAPLSGYNLFQIK